jgi:hypothetical protein
MRMMPIKDRPELTEAIKRAVEWFDNLPPDKKREHLAAQRKSWVIGEMMLEHPKMTREEAERIYEEIRP